MFLLGHLCSTPPTANLKVGELFMLVSGIDRYIEQQKANG